MTTTPQTNATLEDIAQLILENESFVLCGHVSPDGDCLGSQLALWHALRALGKRATCLLVKDDPLPPSFAFMPGAEAMVPAARFEGAADVFLGLDVPTRERIGEAGCAVLDRCARSATIDHHAVPERMCELAYVDPDSASASILVWQLAKILCEGRCAIPAESALCAYVGLVSDTGSFRYQNSDLVAFRTAAELVGLGVDSALVATKLYQSRSLASVKLDSLVADRMVLGANGAFACSWVLAQDMQRLGAEKGDTDSLIDVLRSIAGVRVACLLREQDDVVRVSLRSKDATDVSALAAELGGGGHKAAAGITLHCTMQEARDLMAAKLEALVAREGD